MEILRLVVLAIFAIIIVTMGDYAPWVLMPVFFVAAVLWAWLVEPPLNLRRVATAAGFALVLGVVGWLI